MKSENERKLQDLLQNEKLVAQKEASTVTISERVPSCLRPLIILDKRASSWLAVCASRSSALGRLRRHMKVLEISCHGVPWLAGTVGSIFIFTTSNMRQLLVNILIALLLDCCFVAVMKAAVRRKRPVENQDDMFVTVSLDGYSFPSGHASRAIMLFLIFLFKCNLSYFYLTILGVWSLIVCLSRIVLARHHIGDVLVGCLLGYFEYLLIEYLWVGSEGTKYFLNLFEVDFGDY